MEVGREMDKQSQRKTISIKINGKDRPFQDNSDKSQTSKGNINELKINGEKKKVNNIRVADTDKEVAASQEVSEDESFDWILPDQDEVESGSEKVKHVPNQKKNAYNNVFKASKIRPQKGMITSIFFTVFFAILLGTSIGVIMLKMVITDETEVNNQTTVSTPVAKETTIQSGKSTVKLPDLSTFIIQNGIFSTEEAAKKAQKEITEKGATSKILELNGQMVIYAGVANSLNDAKELSAELKEKKIEVYAKEITFEGKTVEEVLTEEKDLLEQSSSIYQLLVKAVSSFQKDSQLSQELSSNLNKQEKYLSSIDNSKLQNENIKQVKTTLSKAILSVKTLENENSNKDMQTLQLNLLSYLEAIQSL